MKKAMVIFYIAFFSLLMSISCNKQEKENEENNNFNVFMEYLYTTEDRMARYYDFDDFSEDFQDWYYTMWISDEWEFMGIIAKIKYGNSIDKFRNKMMERVRSAIKRSENDFFYKVNSDNNFKNEIKTLLEQLDAYEDSSPINDLNKLLNENGYSLDKYSYNNIERMAYKFVFFIYACMFLDHEFPDNNITDSVIDKMEINLNEIMDHNS